MKYMQHPVFESRLPGLIKPAEFDLQNKEQQLAIAILIATVAYQTFLCFCNTHVFTTSRALVGLSEGLIYLACLPLIARRLLPGTLILALLAGAMLTFLAIVSGFLNVKAARDLIIPICYFWVGCNIGKPEVADKALKYVIAIVLFLGLWETFFLNQYTTVFNIYGYYVSAGNLQVITDYARDNNLQLNGTRPEGIGRTLLPGLLGPHRVSSIFLEPVSLGNFATICAAWGLSRDNADWKKSLYFLSMAIVLMVLSDSRFALMSVSLMIGMRMFINGKALNFAILMPFVCIILLLIVGIYTPGKIGDNFQGRLAISGWSLLDFSVRELLGAKPGGNYGDQGYAYAFSNFGLPLCLLAWFSFWLLPMPDERGLRFRAYVSIYISLILCVSGNSLFALKTAGVVWFLLGCCMMSPVPAPKKIKALMPSSHSSEVDTLRKNHVS